MKKLMMYIGCIALCTTLVSCDKWLTIQPEDEIEKSKLYETEEGFWQAMNGIYTSIGTLHGPVSALQIEDIDYLAGIWLSGSESTFNKLSRHEYKDNDVDGKLANIFLNEYNTIAQCNTLLEFINKVKFLPEKSYNLLKGEAMALRAWCHFDLIRLWGPMPTKIDTRYRYLPYVKQASKAVNVYDTYDDFMKALISDLDSATVLLEKSDPLLQTSCKENNTNESIKTGDRYEYYWRQNRFNYYATLGLRARIALWMGDKETALKYANLVKDAKNPDGSAKFTLGVSADLSITNSERFKTNGNTLKTEHLFSYQLDDYNCDQYYNIGSLSIVNIPVSNVENLFEDKNDFRYKLMVVSSSDYYTNAPLTMTTFKYKCGKDVWSPQIRLAEMYLIIMECGTLENANQVYKELCKARETTYNEMAESSRQGNILKEYYKEFIAEGQIFYANKRMGIERMLWSNEKSSEAQYVLPIPRRETEIFN